MVGQLNSAFKGDKVKGSRRQLEQHMKRFCESAYWIHSFFTDLGYRLGFTQDIISLTDLRASDQGLNTTNKYLFC